MDHNPWKIILKRLSPPQGKRMASPKDLKPKIHEEIGLRAHETKGRKKRPSPPRSEDKRKKRKSLGERTGPRSLEDAKGSGSSRHAAQSKWD